MNLDTSEFISLNVSPDFKLPETLDYFTLTAPPNTRICRKESSRDETTAPMVLTQLSHPLVVAEVTITAGFEMEWDQAGLVVFVGSPHPRIPRSSVRCRPRLHPRTIDDRNIEDEQGTKWVKAGLEYTDGTMNASSMVATSSHGADWSLSPILLLQESTDPVQPFMASLRIKFERIGDSLWIWCRSPAASSFLSPRSPEAAFSEWRKLREVMGFFYGLESKGDVWIGCYASRPVSFVPEMDWDEQYGMPGFGEGRGLVAEFEDLEIL